MKKPKKVEATTKRGIIIPCGWDDNDTVNQVMLSATDDEDYIIENGQKFLEYIHFNIEASGVVNWKKRSFKTINIKKFRIIDAHG